MYVGSSANVKQRITNHLNDYCIQQHELHDLMRRNGFNLQIVETIHSGKDSHLEYDWIDYFKTQTDLKLFNVKTGILQADWHRIGGVA